MEFLLPLFFLIPFALIAVVFGLWLWALVDALQVPADVFYRSGSKVLWGILIGVMGPLAAVVYFAAGRPDGATRAWMDQQRAAGVDLRVYRIYDQPAGWAASNYGPPPRYVQQGYGPSAGGYGQVGPPPGYVAPPAPWPAAAVAPGEPPGPPSP